MTLKRTVLFGAILLIVLGMGHAIHVGQSDDVEPYLWVASVFALVQGLLTIVLIRRTG
jgi:hypothetical protein